MAKQTLPTNFQDDIMSDSMNGKRRYRMIQNTDGTVSFEDATDYDIVGSNFGSAQINATNTAVNESADKNKILDSLDDIVANTQPGYIAGALAVSSLNSKLDKLQDNQFGTYITLTKGVEYQTQSDGYISVIIPYGSVINGVCDIYINNKQLCRYVQNSSNSQIYSLYIKKGMFIRFTDDKNIKASATFCPTEK